MLNRQIRYLELNVKLQYYHLLYCDVVKFGRHLLTLQRNVNKFKVRRSVHHQTIQINHQLDATISPVYYPEFYLQFNMFQASSCPSSGAQQLQ